MDVLQDETEHPAQLAEVHFANVDAVDQNAPARDIVESQQQTDEGRLPRARCADNPDPLARLHFERHVPKHVVVVFVGKGHVSKTICP